MRGALAPLARGFAPLHTLYGAWGGGNEASHEGTPMPSQTSPALWPAQATVMLSAAKHLVAVPRSATALARGEILRPPAAASG